MRFRSIAAVAASFAFVATSPAGVIVGPVANPVTGHSYYLLTQNTWSSSESEARSLGGHLVTVDNAAENAWTVSQFSEYGGVHRALWIGLTDQATEGTFLWGDGTPLAYTNWGAAAPGRLPEPNNYLGIEDWAHIFPSTDFRYGTWNDAPNDGAGLGFNLFGVAEVVPEPATASLLWVGALGVRRCRRR